MTISKFNLLTTTLLVGIVAPSMVIAPLQPVFAQAPDQDRPHGPGAGPRGGEAGGMRGQGGPREGGPREGGPRGDGGPRRAMPGMERGPREGGPRQGGPRAAGPGEQGPREQGPREQGPREQGPRDRGPRDGGGRGAGPRDEDMPAASRPDRAARPPAAADDDNTGPRRGGRRGRDGDAGPGRPDRAAQPPGAPGDAGADRGPRGGERAQRRGRPDDDAPRTPTRDDAARPGPDGRRFGNQPGPGERAAPDDRRPGADLRGGAPAGPGERRRGDEGRPGAGRDRPGAERDRDDAGPGDRPLRDDRRRGGLNPAGAAAIGAAAGFAGGFMAGTAARRIDDVRRDRRQVVEDGRTFIREPGRTIIQDGDRRFVVHDPNDRFRELGYRIDRRRSGADMVDTVLLPGGDAVLTYTTPDGRLLRRVRRGRDGREVVLFENVVRPVQEDVVVLPPPPLRIPRDRYVVDYAAADAGAIYDTLIAPPVAPPPQRYTLDQVLYSPDVRGYVRSIDINTINFDTGSWIVPGDQTQKLVALADAINKALDRDPNSVFLIEGYTDAVGNPTDNLSLSDRRAQSVAAILTKDFKVPPENLTTQGYGDQNLKVNTSGPSAANRRVVVRNITQLLAAGGAPPQ